MRVAIIASIVVTQTGKYAPLNEMKFTETEANGTVKYASTPIVGGIPTMSNNSGFNTLETIADEMAAWMDKNGVKTLDEIRGCARNAE